MKFFEKLCAMGKNTKNLLRIQYVLPLIFLLMPSLSMAANLFDPAPDDVSLKVLGALFGGLMPDAANASDPMMEAIKMFNSGVLIIGGILAAYTILAGTLGTAHDGEMLGKKFSSVWIPIRYSVGTALVLPVVGGGYCVMQAIVMWLVVQGVGLADQVWASYMKNPTTSANTSTIPAVITNIQQAADNAFQSAVCYKAYQRAIKEADSWLGWEKAYEYGRTKTNQGYVFGDTKSLSNTGCGEVLYPKLTGDFLETNVGAVPNSNPGRLGNLDAIFTPMDITALQRAHVTQTDNLVTQMDALATEVVNTNGPITRETAQGYHRRIEEAANNYARNIQTLATSTLSSQNGFAKIQSASQQQGWILAGAWFTRIVKMNELVYGAVNQSPTGSPSKPGIIDSSLFSDAAKYLTSIDAVLNVDKPVKVNRYNTSKGSDSQKQDNSGVEVNEIWGKMQASFSSSLTKVNLYELKNDARHPIIIISEIGSRLELLGGIIMGSIMIAAGAIATGAALWPGAATVVQVVITVAGWFIGAPLAGLVGASIALKYFLPNLPFIIWIGCVTGWVLLVIEAILAAPLWAIMHLHPNGDDLTGRGGNGYMLVLSLLLRPVLMVFGFIAALVMSSVIGEFINKTFFEVFANSAGPSSSTLSGVSGLLALLAGTILYFTVMYTFLKKCFGLMHQLPDQLLKWIGGGDNALGQFAGEFSQSAVKAQAIGAAVGGGASNAVASNLHKYTQQGQKNIKDHERNMDSADGADAEPSGPGQRAMKILSSREQGASGLQAIANGYTPGNDVQRSSDGRIRSNLGERRFDDKALNTQVGDGTAQAKNSMSPMKEPGESEESFEKKTQAFHEAFHSGVRSAHSAGGEESRDTFVEGMKAAKANNFANHGGDGAQAAQAIGSTVTTNAIKSRLGNSGYSQPAISLISTLAGDGNGQINNGAKANAIINSLNKMENILQGQGIDSDVAKSGISESLNKINTDSNTPQEAEKLFRDFYRKTSS